MIKQRRLAAAVTWWRLGRGSGSMAGSAWERELVLAVSSIKSLITKRNINVLEQAGMNGI